MRIVHANSNGTMDFNLGDPYAQGVSVRSDVLDLIEVLLLCIQKQNEHSTRWLNDRTPERPIQDPSRRKITFSKSRNDFMLKPDKDYVLNIFHQGSPPNGIHYNIEYCYRDWNPRFLHQVQNMIKKNLLGY